MTIVLSKPPKNRYWLNYHEEMTEKYRYFVRGHLIEPVYTDEDLEELTEMPGGYIDVFNCGWDRDKWNTEPYKYRFSNNGNKYEWFAHPSTLKPNHSSYIPAGMRLNGAWKELHYRDSAGEYDTSFFWGADGYCLVNHAGKSFRRNESGKWEIHSGSSSINLDGLPENDLIPQARRINAEKWRGFYQPIIDFLISDGMNETQI